MKRTRRLYRLGGPLVLAGGLLLSPLPAQSQSEGAPSQGGDIDIGLGEDMAINVEVSTVEKTAFDRAKTQMAAEDYVNAAVAFDELLKNPKAKEYHQESEYLLAKALYRMGYYHASLGAFVRILQKGDEHKFSKTSKEWLFFISRKAADQSVVVEEIARFAADSLPEKYADEFHYLLAKLYFRKATDDELIKREQQAPPPAAPANDGNSDDDDGGFEFDADALGSGGDGFDFDLDDLDESPKKKPKPAERPKVQKRTPPPAREVPVEKKEPEQKQEEDTGFSFDNVDINIAPAEEKKPAAEEAPPPAVAPRELVGSQKEALDKCVEQALQVKPESNLFLRATYLKSVCYYELQEFEKAVEGFREVVRLTNPKNGKFKQAIGLREEAFFSLARTHYAFQQFRAAIFYYNKIGRDSQGWLDALFESSWAYFRLADYEKALGNLVTLHAPFFAAEYFPESHILKAVTYYENCRYPEALGILTEFEKEYGPLRDELDKLTKDAKTPEDYYALLKKLEDQKNATALTQRLVMLARSDRTLRLMNASAKELEAEEKRLANAPGAMKGSKLALGMLEDVKKRREQLAVAAGTIARAKLEAERDELKSLSSQLFRIKFEITKREKEGLEASLRGEKQGTQLGGYRFTAAVADDELYWPFEGEYWRDELGTYQYTLSKGCRQ